MKALHHEHVCASFAKRLSAIGVCAGATFVSPAALAQDHHEPCASRGPAVTLINVYEVPVGSEEETLLAWERARDFMRQQPGYVCTRLHRALDGGARFAFVNVAQWESAQAFQAASQAMQRASAALVPAGVRFTPALYRLVRE